MPKRSSDGRIVAGTYLQEDEMEALKLLAEREQRTVSNMIRRLIVQAIEAKPERKGER